jgi:ribosome-associated toxin RatA of RatAB toxin-antitoxin module
VGVSRAEQSIDIAAPPETCFEAIVDFETYPDWQEAVIRTEVVQRYGEGLGKIVELEVDAKVRRVTYRLHYHYDRPGRLWWDFVEGDGISYIDGEYVFEPAGAETTTHATYRLGIDAGVPIPGFIAKRLNEGVMRRAIEDLKREAERRASV